MSHPYRDDEEARRAYEYAKENPPPPLREVEDVPAGRRYRFEAGKLQFTIETPVYSGGGSYMGTGAYWVPRTVG